MANKTMTLTQVKNTPKSFDDTHTVSIGGFKPGKGGNKHPSNSKAPKYFVEFQNMMLKFIKAQEQHWNRQEQFNQYVLDQLKKHGWMLEQIDKRINSIVSKNNLKE